MRDRNGMVSDSFVAMDVCRWVLVRKIQDARENCRVCPDALRQWIQTSYSSFGWWSGFWLRLYVQKCRVRVCSVIFWAVFFLLVCWSVCVSFVVQ